MQHRIGIIADNAYTTIRIHEIPEENSRILEMNSAGAAKYAENEEHLFDYQYYIERNFIEPLGQEGAPKHVLVIGAGGFIAGLEDGYNQYTFVDIDPDLKDITEKYLHKKPLSDNKAFYPEPARAFLNQQPTSFVLTPEAVDRLRAAAGAIIMASPEFQRLLKDVGAQVVADPSASGGPAVTAPR